MTSTEYENFKSNSINSYAKEICNSKKIQFAVAVIEVQRKYESILTDGQDTLGHSFYSIYSSTNKYVGNVWLHINESNEAFIYDIFVNEAERRKGFANQTISTLIDLLKNTKVTLLDVHVYLTNISAIKLYEKNSFVVLKEGKDSKVMRKRIV